MKKELIMLYFAVSFHRLLQSLVTFLPICTLVMACLFPSMGHSEQNELLIFSPDAEAMLPTGKGVIKLDEAFLQKNSETYRTIDTGFKTYGIEPWRGVPLERILAVLKKSKETSITFLGKDSYVCQESLDSLKALGGFIAIDVAGKPVSENRGGPVKLMFQKDNIPGAYCWYVKAIFAGNPKNSAFSVEKSGKRKIKTITELKNLPQVTEVRTLPLPRGHRRDLAVPEGKVKITGILLKDLVQQESAGSPTSSIVLRPLFGPEITLSEADWRSPVLVIFEVQDKPIPVAFGGPVSILFPSESKLEAKWKGFFFLSSMTLL